MSHTVLFHSFIASLLFMSACNCADATSRTTDDYQQDTVMVSTKYKRPDDRELRKRLTAEQWAVTQESATEQNRREFDEIFDLLNRK